MNHQIKELRKEYFDLIDRRMIDCTLPNEKMSMTTEAFVAEERRLLIIIDTLKNSIGIKTRCGTSSLCYECEDIFGSASDSFLNCNEHYGLTPLIYEEYV